MVDLLGPMPAHVAQLAENAFEEDQAGEAVETLRTAFRMGMYPTRDLFMTVLAIILSAPDPADVKTNKRPKHSKLAENAQFGQVEPPEMVEIERSTVTACFDLVEDLVQAAPGVIRRYLPSLRASTASKLGQSLKPEENMDPLHQKLEQRDWLRRWLDHETHSSTEETGGRGRSRSRKPSSGSSSAVLELATKMLQCPDCFALLALDPSRNGKADESNGTALDTRSKAKKRLSNEMLSREGESEEEKEERFRQIMLKYDRPGTWSLLDLLATFWEGEMVSVDSTKGPKQITSHFVDQLTETQRHFSRHVSNILGHAFQVIEVGLSPSLSFAPLSFRKDDRRRTLKAVQAIRLLVLLYQSAMAGSIDLNAFYRGLRPVVDKMDPLALHAVSQTNLWLEPSLMLARTVIHFLKDQAKGHTLETHRSTLSTNRRLNEIVTDAMLPEQQKRFLELIEQPRWIARISSWSYEEELNLFHALEGEDPAIQGLVQALSQDPDWILCPSDDENSSERTWVIATDEVDVSLAWKAFLITVKVKVRTIDCMLTRTQMQRGVAACLEEVIAQQHSEDASLQRFSADVAKRLHSGIESDCTLIRICLDGMYETYASLCARYDGDVDEQEDEQGKKRKRTEHGKRMLRAARHIADTKRQWAYLALRIEQSIDTMTAEPFSLTRARARLSSQAANPMTTPSDVTDLTQDD